MPEPFAGLHNMLATRSCMCVDKMDCFINNKKKIHLQFAIAY